MATLTETAYYSRRTITYAVVGIVAFFILRGLLGLAIATYRKLNPPPPPPPTVAFGKLPAVVFPEKEPRSLTYSLDTVTGATPDVGDRATVYFMPVRQPNLLALQRMTEQAKLLDFEDEPEAVEGTLYRFTRADPLPATLTADIVSGSFALQVAWQQDQSLLVNKNLPSQTQAIQEGERFLQSADLLSPDLLTGKTTVSYLRADVDKLVPAVSLSEADFVRVDFFRSAIEDIPVYTPDPERGVVSLVFSGSLTPGKRVVEVKYNYFPVDYEQSATYPIRSSSEAWSELQAGQGFVADLDPNIFEVTVRTISLGYYDANIPQTYLQPVYVFEGDNGFVGYMSAISGEWVE